MLWSKWNNAFRFTTGEHSQANFDDMKTDSSLRKDSTLSLSSAERLLKAAQNRPVDRPPVWMMRQAGRYLKAYRDLRQQYPSFRMRSEIPELAIAISLQPFHAFHPDGVILFSDILTPLSAMGIEFEITESKGPVLAHPIRSQGDLETLRPLHPEAELSFIGQILRGLCDELQGQTAILGFVGAPWTLATYLVEGQNSVHYSLIKRMAFCEPALLHQLLTKLAEAISTYALYQIRNGAEVMQIFDSWAGCLTPIDYATFVLPYQQEVIQKVKFINPEVPVILGVHDSTALLPLMAQSGADVIHIDWTVPISQARHILGDSPVQGNLDPAILLGTPDVIQQRTLDIIQQAGTQGHIMNLGQGILQNTPEDNVRCFFETVQAYQYA